MSFLLQGIGKQKQEVRRLPGIIDKFDLGVKNEAWQRITEFSQENMLVMANTLFQQPRDNSKRGHHWMVNIEIRLIMSFKAEDGDALYSQQKQDQDLTVAHITSSLLKIQTQIEESWENHQAIRYDLNQIPYDYTVEVMNKFKGSSRQSV